MAEAHAPLQNLPNGDSSGSGQWHPPISLLIARLVLWLVRKNWTSDAQECCGRVVCDDVHTYRVNTFAHNSCYRNHSRYTACATHFNEGHSPAVNWKDCINCRDGTTRAENYVWYGTSRFNFPNDVLPNPPSFDPTYRAKCSEVIVMNVDSHTRHVTRGYALCGQCSDPPMPPGGNQTIKHLLR
jgi:hypothetical protein